MAEKFHVQDRLEIMDVLNRYAWGYDQRDLQMMGNSFAQEGHFSIFLDGSELGSSTGRDNVVKWLEGFMKQQTDQRRHVISNVVFEKQNENYAKVISYLACTTAQNHKVRLVTTGRYQDELEKENGEWCILRKELFMDAPF
jgi:hypothetical protein